MTFVKRLLAGLLLGAFFGAAHAQDRALLVGIDSYSHISQLVGSKKDVENMRAFIQSVWKYRPGQIRILTDAQATRKNILNAFDEWLIAGSQAGDRVLFYYSGHGYRMFDDGDDETDGLDETLCPVDTRKARSKVVNMIRDDEVESRIKRLKGREIMMIVDACHSGTLTRSLLAPKPDLTVKRPIFPGQPLQRGVSRGVSRSIGQGRPDGFIATHRNLTAYSAVAPNQVALVDVENTYMGVFTRRFIEGVKEKRADNNRDGQVSHAELLDYVRTTSQAYCKRNPTQCHLGALSPQLEANSEMLAVDVLTGKAPLTDDTAGQAISLLAHDNQAGLQVKILPGTRFRVGGMMKLNVSSDRSGYLFLFDINSAGSLTRIFPNPYSEAQGKQGFVKAGSVLSIPDPYYGFDFIAEEPAGKGLLLALLAEDKLSGVQALLPKAFEQIRASKAQAVLQQLRQQLNQTILRENGVDRPMIWSLSAVEYKITH
ncbi:MAG: DUF4384 domain-containing protein [Gammaproteobacteria bacterium]|nr:DUF4384 domain-containing protein [Gammaproteobacteria bacterium]